MIDCSHTTDDIESLCISQHTVSKHKIGCLLLRVFRKNQEEAYRYLKLNVMKKKKNINLPLLMKRMHRNIEITFITIKEFCIIKLQNKINSRLQLIKKPQILITVCCDWLRRSQKIALMSLKRYSHHINFIKSFIPILHLNINKLTKQKQKISFNKILQKARKITIQRIKIKEVQRIEKKGIRRIKQECFNWIIDFVIKQKLNTLMQIKKSKIKQNIDVKNFTIKNVSSLREEVKLLQNEIISKNNEINSCKILTKRQVKANKIKVQEEIKRSEEQICKDKLQSDILMHQLLERESLGKKREIVKQNSKDSQSKLKKIYQTIMNHPDDQFRNLKILKPYIGVALPIQQVDQFHIYKNLKLKQLLRIYENNLFTVNTPQYYRSLSENQKLRDFIKLINLKRLEPISSSSIL